jgi:TRAP transporter TAXI family solute receptor
LPYGQDVIDKVRDINPGLFDLTIPKGIYNGIDEDVAALGYTLTVFANKNVSEDLVYQLAKMVDENIAELYDSVAAMKGIKGKDLFMDVGVPYHPGAAKYMKEMGY